LDEVAAHDGEVCPERLPQADEADYGLGTDQSAASAPTLPAIESAWVCQYSPTEADPGPEGSGTPWAWVRDGEARSVDEALLPDIESDLSELAPSPDHQMCTADLGPRWMLVYAAAGGDLTGVVVDDFGCRSVLLTDEPFETVPGEATQSGIVPGVLTAPDGLLDAIKAAAAG
jgi:hypothetical protein